MGQSKLDLLQGTLDVMVLQTLEAMGPQHGYGVARRIEQVSGNEVLLNQGTIYASLVRLQQRGWIAAKWGTSDNNRMGCVGKQSQGEVLLHHKNRSEAVGAGHCLLAAAGRSYGARSRHAGRRR